MAGIRPLTEGVKLHSAPEGQCSLGVDNTVPSPPLATYAVCEAASTATAHGLLPTVMVAVTTDAGARVTTGVAAGVVAALALAVAVVVAVVGAVGDAVVSAAPAGAAGL